MTTQDENESIEPKRNAKSAKNLVYFYIFN